MVANHYGESSRFVLLFNGLMILAFLFVAACSWSTTSSPVEDKVSALLSFSNNIGNYTAVVDWHHTAPVTDDVRLTIQTTVEGERFVLTYSSNGAWGIDGDVMVISDGQTTWHVYEAYSAAWVHGSPPEPDIAITPTIFVSSLPGMLREFIEDYNWTLEGEIEIDGQRMYHLSAEDSIISGRTLHIWADAESHVPKKLEVSWRGWRDVFYYESLEWNVDLDAALFSYDPKVEMNVFSPDLEWPEAILNCNDC